MLNATEKPHVLTAWHADLQSKKVSAISSYLLIQGSDQGHRSAVKIENSDSLTSDR